MTNALDVFVCARRRGARLTVASCTRDHAAAKNAPRRLKSGGLTDEWQRLQHCDGCTTGLEHALGKTPARWPDGEVIERRVFGRAAEPEKSAPPSIVPAPIERGDRRRLPVLSAHHHELAAAVVAATREVVDVPVRVAMTMEAARLSVGATKEKDMAREKRTITHGGKTKTLDEWASEIGVSKTTIHGRLAKGWTESEAVTTPPGEGPSSSAASAPKPAKKPARVSKPAAAIPTAPKFTPGTANAAFALELLTAAGVVFEHKLAPNGITLIFIAPA